MGQNGSVASQKDVEIVSNCILVDWDGLFDWCYMAKIPKRRLVHTLFHKPQSTIYDYRVCFWFLFLKRRTDLKRGFVHWWSEVKIELLFLGSGKSCGSSIPLLYCTVYFISVRNHSVPVPYILRKIRNWVCLRVGVSGARKSIAKWRGESRYGTALWGTRFNGRVMKFIKVIGTKVVEWNFEGKMRRINSNAMRLIIDSVPKIMLRKGREASAAVYNCTGKADT